MYRSCFTLRLAVVLLGFLLISSCSKDELEIEPVRNAGSKIEAIYKPYVDRFFDEAAKRKVNVNDLRLQVLTGFPRPEYCGLGYSNYLGNGSMRVEISPEPSCWTNRSDVEKEILMFHELGHAMLERQHKEGNLPLSLPVSIMCSETCNGLFNIYTEFTPQLREYYIDELFDPNTATPSWAPKTSSSLAFEDKFDDLDNEWSFFAPNDSSAVYSSVRLDDLGSNNKALSISSSENSTDNTFSFWRKIFPKPDFPVGSGLRLSVDISSESLIGKGVSIAIRTDSESQGQLSLSAFNSTQGDIQITGNLDMQTFSVSLGYFPEKVEQVQVFLIMLNETVGKVYFDNVRLELLE